MEEITQTAEWIDYPWEMGLSSNDVVDKNLLEILLRAGKGLYYTYVLWREKNGFPQPFYIGKGINRRVLQHEAPSENSYNPLKSRIIKKSDWIGYSIRFFDSEDKAFQKEIEWIELIGTVKEKTGPLSNLKEGGIKGGGQSGMVGAANHMSIPIFVDGVRYESMSLAGKAFNISVASVRHRCDHAIWPEWVMEGNIKKPARGIRRPKIPLSVDGVIYKNPAEAAKFLKMHFNSIRYRCKSPSYPTWFFLSSPEKITLKPKHRMVRVLAEGMLYESITAAAKAYGMGVNCMRFRCEDSRFTEFEYKGSNK